MARGFESKSVQEQWQDAEARAAERGKERVDRAEMERRKKVEELQLSRARIVHEMEATTSDRRRDSLQAALSFLDQEIAKVEH